MNNFLIVANQVAILFLLMGVGAALRRFKLLKESGIEGLVNLLMLIVTPCLIVDVFQRPFSPAMLRGLFFAFAIAALCHLIAIGLSLLLVRNGNEEVRKPLLLAAVFSNAGFMGVPLEQAILGDLGVFFGAVYIAVFNLFIWSWGISVMSRPSLLPHPSSPIPHPSSLILNPGTVGIAVGLPLFLTSTTLPAVLHTPIHLIAGVNTPLAMIVIGYFLAGARLNRIGRMPSVYVSSLLRLVAFPLLVVGMLYPFRTQLDRNMMLAIVIASSAPVAAMVSMFATKFGRDVDVAVAVVSGTTLLSIVTMPAVIAIAMSVL